MPLPVRNGVQNTAPYLINDPAIPQPATYAVFQQGGYHALDFLDDGTENSLYGIKRHHRAWDMLVAIKQNRITYKLVDGHYNSDLMDNRNWKVWKDDNQSTNITNSGGLAPWSAQEATAGEYDANEFVGHNGTIWRSTADNNLAEPGTDASWEESSLDRLAHQRNKDTGLVTSTGVFFSLDQVLDLIAAKIAKTALDTDIALDNSDEKVATSKAVKSYVDSLIANALRNPKPFDASTATTFPVGVAGDTYRVTVAGKVQGVKLQAGDLLFTDKPNAGAVAGDWYAIQSNVDQATQTVIGLLRLATEQETIDETLSDVAVSPFTLGRWFQNVLTRSGLFFREVVAVLGLQLGSLTTAGSTRTIEARGSAADVSIELKVQGNGKLKTNALAHAGSTLR